jgi:hypothetical protein
MTQLRTGLPLDSSCSKSEMKFYCNCLSYCRGAQVAALSLLLRHSALALVVAAVLLGAIGRVADFGTLSNASSTLGPGDNRFQM